MYVWDSGGKKFTGMYFFRCSLVKSRGKKYTGTSKSNHLISTEMNYLTFPFLSFHETINISKEANH